MKALKTILISASTVLITFYLLIKFFGNVTDQDLNGFTPKTLFEHHQKLCQEVKIDEALSLWTPESLERNSDLRNYCSRLGTLELKNIKTGKGKLDTILFVSADIIDEQNSYILIYFELRDSNWHLHCPPLIR